MRERGGVGRVGRQAGWSWEGLECGTIGDMRKGLGWGGVGCRWVWVWVW